MTDLIMAKIAGRVWDCLIGRVVKVIFTEPDEETRRIISVRKALQHERKHYEQFLQKQLGAG